MDENHNCLGNLWENFQRCYWENSKICIILNNSQQNFKNPALIYRTFGRKMSIVRKYWETFENIWWKFNRKIEKNYLVLEEVWLKIGHSEISAFYYNIFSISGRETFPVFPPGGLYIFEKFIFLERIILKISMSMWRPYKSRENSDEVYFLVEKFIKNRSKIG